MASTLAGAALSTDVDFPVDSRGTGCSWACAQMGTT
jgi:hypothetical protein